MNILCSGTRPATGTQTNCVQKGARGVGVGGGGGAAFFSGARGCSRHTNNLCSGTRVWNRDMNITILC